MHGYGVCNGLDFEEEYMHIPKLQVQDPLHAVLRDIVVVEERIGDARDAEEEDTGRGEEEGAEVGSLGGLGYGGVEGEERRLLDSGWFSLGLFLGGFRGKERRESLTMVLTMKPGRSSGFGSSIDLGKRYRCDWFGLGWFGLLGGEARLALAYIFRFGNRDTFWVLFSTFYLLSSSSNPPWKDTSTGSSHDAQTQEELWQTSRQTSHLQCLFHITYSFPFQASAHRTINLPRYPNLHIPPLYYPHR